MHGFPIPINNFTNNIVINTVSYLARVMGGEGVSVIDYILPGAPFHIKIISTEK